MQESIAIAEQIIRLDVALAVTIGAVGGVVIGAIPGVGPAVAIAILLPATFQFEPLVRDHPAARHLRSLDVRRGGAGHPDQHPRHAGQRADHL